MLWTQQKLDKVRDILSRHEAMGTAHEEICAAIGERVSKTSVRAAFQRAEQPSPHSFLGSDLPKLPIGDWDQEKVERFNTLDSADVAKAFNAINKRAKSAGDNIHNRPRTTRIVVVSDLHVPYHDSRAWECVLQTIRETKPETVVIIGDFADMYSISSHPKSLDRKINFADEVEAVNVELDALRLACGPRCRLTWTEGNHEDRITRYLQSSAPELGGIAGMRAEGLFRVKERGIEWVPYRRHVKIGNCAFTHDVGRCGVNAARQSLLDFGGNIVFGHSHRGACVYQGEAKGSSHFGLNVGWLGDIDGVDYQHRVRCLRDWQQGFGIVDQDDSGYSWGQFIPIVDGRCVVDGKVISGRRASN